MFTKSYASDPKLLKLSSRVLEKPKSTYVVGLNVTDKRVHKPPPPPLAPTKNKN